MEKKQLTLVVVSLLVVVLSVSVAYFTAQIIGDGKTIDVASANLQIIFGHTDGQIAGTDIEPGWKSTKTFTVKNSTKSEYKYNIVLKDLVNTFVTEGYLQYKITSTNSGYNMTEFKDVPKSSTATDTILAYSVSVPVGTTQTYTIVFKYSNDENVDQSKDMGKKLNGSLFITEGTQGPPKEIEYANGTLGKQLLADKTTRPGTRLTEEAPGFSRISHYNGENTKTLYTSTENNTVVYLFAGNPTDNWVKFGKNSDGTDLYWRIIRTNDDESIRLLYHGTSHDSTTAYINPDVLFNTLDNNPMYVGYMYGTSGSLESNRLNTKDSFIKSKIDSWYLSNLIYYSNYLSNTAVYCNDRELMNGITYSDTGNLVFGPSRVQNNLASYDCPNVSDKFTVDSSVGNGKLDFPIALMTADEVVFAGGEFGTDFSGFYYYNSVKGSSTGSAGFWTMSPYQFYGRMTYGLVVRGENNQYSFDESNVNMGYSIRPVTSLKSCVKWASGDGTADSPYTIDESYEC